MQDTAWTIICPKGHAADLDEGMKSKVYVEDGIDFDTWYAQCPECGEKYWL
jgi:hypothetical protein